MSRVIKRIPNFFTFSNLRTADRNASRLALSLLALIILLLTAGTGGAQTRRNSADERGASSETDQNGKGSISGYVTDAGGGVLQGAAVSAQPGGYSTVSDTQGQFTIGNLAPGEYTVTVSYSGFAVFTSKVKLAADQKASLNVSMQIASANQSVQVHADLQGVAEEIQIQRTSENIVNVISADVIRSLPNANIADAVGRLPGVSLERDEGEGKYVQIRGTEPRLTNVTINGINVPSPEATVRQVKLDVIPADLVETIELNKTLTASQDGDAIGGTVDLKLKSAGDQPTLILEAIGGRTPILGGRYVGTADTTVGQRFGADKRFGVLFGYTYDYNGRGIDDIEPGLDTGPQGFPTPYYDSLDLREYRYQRTRWGLGGTVDYRLKENSSFYVNYLYSDFKDYGNKWVYTINDGDVPEFKTSQRTPDFKIGLVSIGAKHVFSNSWLAWNISVADAGQQQAAGNPGVTFDPIVGVACNFDQAATTNPHLPRFNSACTAPGSATFDPTQYEITEFDTSSGPTGQVNLQGSVAWGKSYKWGSHTGTFEVGAKLRNAHKYQNANSPVWDPNGTFLMSDFLSGFKADNYYGGAYNYGPVTSYRKLKNFFDNNPSDFTEDISNTHLGSDPNNYNLTERVSAGYVVNNLQFGKWRLQTGLRLEATQLDIQGFQVLTIPTGQPNAGDWLSTTPERTSQWYIDPLPSVQLRYNLTADSDIRAGYGRGLSRPDPYDLVPFSLVDQSTNPFTVQIGNPSLKPEHANDFDILYEHYLKPYGVIQAGFFYKQLQDPIYSTDALPAASGPYEGLFVQQNINGSNANVRGVELAYVQQFDFLPSALRGLGMTANYTYTASNAGSLPGRTDQPALQRQAPHTFNIIPGYDRGRVSIHVGMTYNSAMIYQYQFINLSDGIVTPPAGGLKGASGDIYLYPHFQLDAQGTVRLSHGVHLVLSGENLNNEVFGFYTGSQRFVDQREFYKPTYSIGVRWTPLREK
ncbi:MAG TPA: TonB-dependent receptor [Candidatus Acidoferrales bacterium]